MRLCKGCGGVIGRDCFNPLPPECEWITQEQESAYFRRQEEDYYCQLQTEHDAELEASAEHRRHG